ncbi:MAG: ATP-binding protein [Spirosomataceae bacterium]
MFTPSSKPFRLLRKIAGCKFDLRFTKYDLRLKLLLPFVFLFPETFAQKKQIDSLSKLISIEKIDTNKVKLNNELAWAYFQAKESSRAKRVVLENIEKAKKLNWNKGIANSYETIGDFLWHEDNLDSSITFTQNAILFYKKTTDFLQICFMLNRIGNRLSYMRKYGKSKQNLIESYDLAIKIKNLDYQYKNFESLGWLYHNMGNQAKSLEYFVEAEKLAIQMNDKQKQINLTSGFADNYIAQGKYKEAQIKQFVAAEYYKSTNDLFNYAKLLGSAANLYRRLNQSEKAEKPLLEVFEIQKKLKDNYNLLTTSRFLGMLYTEQKRFKEAEKYLNESLILANYFNDALDKIKAYYTLERLFYAKNDFIEGDKYQKKIIRIRDSLYTADNNKALAEFDVKYKTAEKERQLAEAKLENAQKQNWIIGLSIAVLSLLGFGFIFYKFREAKQRTMVQSIEIEKQREILKAREIERQRIAKELHDSVGSQLTVVSTSLDNAFFLAENQKLVPQKLESINKDVREAAQSLRDTIWATHNSTISIANLYSRIQHYLFKIAEDNHNLQITSNRLGSDYELNSIQALNIFRVFQEAIQNIQKHTEATQINIELSFEQGQLELSIGDNGRGFDKDELNINENFGLSNMKNRSDEIGAHFSIDSEVAKGTTVTLALPLT